MKTIHPDWNSSQIMRHVSNIWQKMTNEEKKDYIDMSRFDRDRYESEKANMK